MERTITLFVAAAAPVAIALMITGCGGSTYGSGQPAPTAEASGAAMVGVADSAGRPLYRFFEDSKPGQTNGEGSQDFGGEWNVLSPAGKEIESDD